MALLIDYLLAPDTLSNRPDPGIEGRLFPNTTTRTLQRDNGISWEDISFFPANGATKGDLSVFNGTNWVIVPAGTDNTVLTADVGEAAGVKWAVPATGSSRLLYAQTADVVITGTSLGSMIDENEGVGTTFIPMGTLQPGDVMRFKVWGTLSTGDSGDDPAYPGTWLAAIMMNDHAATGASGPLLEAFSGYFEIGAEYILRQKDTGAFCQGDIQMRVIDETTHEVTILKHWDAPVHFIGLDNGSLGSLDENDVSGFNFDWTFSADPLGDNVLTVKGVMAWLDKNSPLG